MQSPSRADAAHPETASDNAIGDDSVAAHEAPRRLRHRILHWLRNLLIAVLGLAVAVTLFSFIFNAATNSPSQTPGSLNYVRTGDINTRYRAWGDPHAAGPPIVLVHGFIENSDTWSQVAPRLANNHYVQAYDMSGFGYTQRRGPYTLQALSDQLGQFLDERHVQRPVLVAHSLGAGVIARFALDHPDRVGGIMFLDGDGIGRARRTSASHSLPDPWRTTLLRLAVRSDWVINNVYSEQCGPRCPALNPEDMDQWREPLEVPGAEDALWSMSQHGLVGLSRAELSRLAATGIPASVVFGADDSGFSHNSPAETARRIGAPAPTLIPNARHLTLISDPGPVAAAIDALAGRVH